MNEEWIEFIHQIPKHNQHVKVKSDRLWIGEGIFQDGKFVYSWIKGATFGNATHWMPLEAPKNENILENNIRNIWNK